MSMSEQSIEQFMTKIPLTVDVGDNIKIVKKLMAEHQINHIPVLKQEKLIGIISERDLTFVSGLKNVNIDQACASDVMTADPFWVPPETSLKKVCETMAVQQIGSTVIADFSMKILGIFTYVDALKIICKHF
ncbi:MAG: CBS domain-containing protein [Oligoflexales bacterium]